MTNENKTLIKDMLLLRIQVLRNQKLELLSINKTSENYDLINIQETLLISEIDTVVSQIDRLSKPEPLY